MTVIQDDEGLSLYEDFMSDEKIYKGNDEQASPPEGPPKPSQSPSNIHSSSEQEAQPPSITERPAPEEEAQVAPPPAPSSPPLTEQRQDESSEGLIDKDIEKVTLKDIVEAANRLNLEAQPPAQPSQTLPEQEPEEEEIPEPEYELDEEGIKLDLLKIVRKYHPDLEQSQTDAFVNTLYETLSPLIENQARLASKLERYTNLENKLRNWEEEVKPLVSNAQYQQLINKASEAREKMKAAFPDFESIEPLMEQYYNNNAQFLNEMYSYNELAPLAKARLLYAIVKSLQANSPEPKPVATQAVASRPAPYLPPPPKPVAKTNDLGITAGPMTAQKVPEESASKLLTDILTMMSED